MSSLSNTFHLTEPTNRIRGWGGELVGNGHMRVELLLVDSNVGRTSIELSTTKDGTYTVHLPEAVRNKEFPGAFSDVMLKIVDT